MSIENDTNEFPPGEGGAGPDAAPEAPLNAGRPAVAAAPGKLIFVLLFAGIFIFIIVRSLFFGEKPVEKPIVKHNPEQVVKDNARVPDDLTLQPGALPSIPPEITVATPPPPPPPPPPPLINPSSLQDTTRVNAPTNEALNRRIHSAMFVVSAGKNGTQTEQAEKKRAAVVASNDPNSAFAQNAMQSHTVEKATKVGNLNYTIIEGKLIHAVLESAIDSDLPGPIRAITSHDTYAEAGKGVLIPKGSRLVGIYNSAIRRGQVRVFIIWQRLIRPDGVDVMIESAGVDGLGRAGMNGDVDNKYFEVFSAAILTSSLDIGVAALGDALFGNQQTTTVTNGSGTTSAESPTAAAMQQAVANVGNIGTNIVNNALNLSPTIYIDQGTPVEVFVNKDLIFPPEVTGSTSFVR